MERLLIVEDDEDLLWILHRALKEAGYDVYIARDGIQALAAVRQHAPDAILLDIMLPSLDGLAVCRVLRGDPQLAAIHILLLTARSSIGDRVEGLEAGADDYLVKPFDFGELLARVRALMRRASAGSQTRLDAYGDLVVNIASREVRPRHGSPRALTPMEFRLLSYFLSRPGRVFSTRELLTQVWGYHPDTADPGLVRWYVRRLRQKIEPDPKHPVYLQTVHGHGYVLAVLPRQSGGSGATVVPATDPLLTK